MANDAPGKQTANDATLSNPIDQQKVPPLRIVLNSATNQKSSSGTTAIVTSVAKLQTNTKKDKAQDAKTEGAVKVGGRVRIKLGTSKQSGGKKTNESVSTKSNGGGNTNEKFLPNINEDSASGFNHLRRITRRSQRAVQTVNNEDDESISSMTSADENLNTNNNLSTGDNIAQDSEQSNSATLTSGSAAAAASSATNGSTTDTPRRHKRRKVETSESQSIDCDNILGSQNYRLPNQNSFQLFKNIRQQVDKRLKNLNNVSPRTPYGFRDYMLTRGAYLLEGNKLGNGTNLFMNEDGGLHSAPSGKYRVLRRNMTSYSVPNRAKVPLGLPMNSPLHDLFVEQEKERYRMRIQHIKEREKLTLAAEQEVIRVYNQAALAAADQTEPFSACTMLKHQEIYNYMDSNGITILSREDALQDQAQSEGVRTRRRQHDHIAPSAPTRKSSDANQPNSAEDTKKGSQSSASPPDKQKGDTDAMKSEDAKESVIDNDVPPNEESNQTKDKSDPKDSDLNSISSKQANVNQDNSGICPITPPQNSDDSDRDQTDSKLTQDDGPKNQPEIKTEAVSPSHNPATADEIDNKPDLEESNQASQSNTQADATDTTSGKKTETSAQAEGTDGGPAIDPKESGDQPVTDDAGSSMSVEDTKIQNNDLFLSKLQDIDDKWEKVRHEMLVRHKNEAESLHAIQMLEWEWRTKEVGACDVRTTLIIDNTLVPRLDIYSQDY